MSKRKKPTKKKKKPYKKTGTDWVTTDSDAIRARLPKEGEFFGVVLQILGASILLVKCLDGFTRQIRIPGKYRKRLWCRVGDVVIIMPLYGMNPDEKGELVHRFRKNEVRWLLNNNHIPEEYAL
ncbi:MAG: translation initiation factor eIF-1A [Candidatus Heimdallarchaeota archaeon]|nr:translation initiation factor eIF-1A [Candidatus Heimdallarchaeota archaeon]